MKAAGFSAQSFVLFYSSLFVASAVTFLKRYSSNFYAVDFFFLFVRTATCFLWLL